MDLAAAATQKAQQLLNIEGLPFGEWTCALPEQPGGCYMGYAFHWPQALLAKQTAAIRAIAKTDITIEEINALDVDSARSAIGTVYALLQRETGNMLQAAKTGNFAQAALALPRLALRKTLVAIYVYNSSGATLHYEGAFERGILEGRISSDDAIRHLNRCATIFDTIAKLGARGGLDWLREGTSGLGRVQGSFPAVQSPARYTGQGTPIYGLGAALPIAMLVVAGLVSLLIWAGFWYMVMVAFNQSRIQSKALDQCDRLLEQGLFEEAERCRQNVLQASNESLNRLMEPVTKATTIVAWSLGIGIMAYVGAKFVLPEVMKARS